MNTAPTISRAVLDHVHAYAAQVRAHLGDLAPDQVEELTDGLEADLAEALADDAAPVATGELPVSGVVDESAGGDGESVLDLTRRFGPAAAYAAELRASAGLGEPTAVLRGRWVRGPARRALRHVRGVVARLAGLRDAAAPLLEAPGWRTTVSLAQLLRPLWWVVRGWMWFVLLRRALDVISWEGVPAEVSVGQFLPVDSGGWLIAVVAVLASLHVGRRQLARGTWGRRAVLVLSVAAAVAMPWAVSTVWARADLRAEVQYVPYEVPVPMAMEPEDGVYVGGMQVSNLFVYDAAGNPLERVQIFDDRGRPVRTTYDNGLGLWWMPGVTDPWRFVSAQDVDGRARWNVYPLMGAPGDAWEDDGEAGPQLPAGQEVRTPPPPFAKAPALVEPAG